MSRPRSAQTSFDFSARPVASSALARHTHPLRARLQTLEGEHEKLLASIARKRAAVQVNAELYEKASQGLADAMFRLRERGTLAISKMRHLLESLVGPQSRLSKRDRKRVAKVLHEVVDELPPDGLGLDDTDAESSEDCAWESSGERSDATAGGGRRATEAGYSASKPGVEHASLKALFKRLAVAAHPDRVQDERSKLERTRIMSEVTQAYERGDLARLLELERSWLEREEVARGDAEALRRQIERLEATNKELRRQLRHLQEEDRELRDSPGTVSASGEVRFRRPVQRMLDDLETMVVNCEASRAFTERFARGEMSVEEFLDGPELDEAFGDDESTVGDVTIDEALLEAILGDFAGEGPRPPRKPARGKKKQRQGKRKKR